MFFAVFFFYIIWYVYDPRILYLNLQPFFAFDTSFYEYNFQFKQGYLSLISQFILQFLYFPVIGSLILVSLFLMLAFIYRRIFQKSISVGFIGIEFFAPLLILWPLKTYTNGLELFVSLFLAGIMFLSSNYLKRNFYLESFWQLFSTFLMLRLFGVAPAIVLTILYIPKDLVSLKHLPTVAVYLGNLLFFFILSYFLYGLRLFEIQLGQLSFTDLTLSFPGFWIICIYVFVGLLPGLFNTSPFKKSVLIKKVNFQFAQVFPLLIILLCVSCFNTLFINTEKYKSQIDLFISDREWLSALQMKDKIAPEDRIARFQLNRALYASEQLNENLFTVPQEWGEYGLLLSKEFSMATMPYSSDFYYDLGFIKASKYCMLEYQTAFPYAPRSLERLANTSLILGEFQTSSKYYTILSKSMIYARHYKPLLEKIRKQPYFLMTESTSAQVSIIKEDQIINFKEPDVDLLNILKVNRNNKMVFEYLMTYYILRNDLESFNKFMPLAMKSGYYSKMPKTWEEALILYRAEAGLRLDSGDIKLNASNVKRYIQFRAIFDSNSSNALQLKEALKPGFKDTFWYYRFFINPNVSGKIITKKL